MRNKELEDVAEFQKLFEVPLTKKGTEIKKAPYDQVELNRRLVDEELRETLHDGVQENSLVKLADGCADSLYVVAHAINQLGRPNNRKRDDAAIVLLNDAISRANLVLAHHPLVSEDDVDRNLAYIEIIVRGIAASYEIPLDDIFSEVHRSNMTKSWPDGSIKKDAGGKVIKPPTYEPARIAEILSERFGREVK